MDKRITVIQEFIKTLNKNTPLNRQGVMDELHRILYDRLTTGSKESTESLMAIIPFMDLLHGDTPLTFYSLTPDFLYMLYKTDLDISFQDLKMPYMSFFMLIPQIGHHDDGKLVDIVSVSTETYGDNITFIYFTFYHLKDSMNFGTRSFSVSSENQDLVNSSISIATKETMIGNPGILFGDRSDDLLKSYTALIIKMLAYLSLENSPGPVLRKNKKRKKKSKFPNVPTNHLIYNIWDIGSEIHLTHKDGSPADPAGSGKSWTLRNRTITRGHMKYQWYGKADQKQRKLIWVKPYIRGAHLPPPALGHVYKI